MAFDKNGKERQLFAEYYRFCEQFWTPAHPDQDDDNGYFRNLTMEYTKLRQKYQDTKYEKFMDDLITAFLHGRYQEAIKNDETL